MFLVINLERGGVVRAQNLGRGEGINRLRMFPTVEEASTFAKDKSRNSGELYGVAELNPQGYLFKKITTHEYQPVDLSVQAEPVPAPPRAIMIDGVDEDEDDGL